MKRFSGAEKLENERKEEKGKEREVKGEGKRKSGSEETDWMKMSREYRSCVDSGGRIRNRPAAAPRKRGWRFRRKISLKPEKPRQPAGERRKHIGNGRRARAFPFSGQGGPRKFLAAVLSSVLFCGTVLSSGSLSGEDTAEAAKIGASSLDVVTGETTYGYIYAADTGHTLNFRVHWVDNDDQLAVYCTQRSRTFNTDGDYVNTSWDASAKFSELAYAMYHGCSAYGDKCDSTYSTGSWIEDYYATQTVIWCILDDYGSDGVSVDDLSAVSGYEEVYECAVALYNATKKNAGDDGYGDTIFLEVDEPDSTVMYLNSKGTYYRTGWYSIDAEGTVTASSVTLSGAPDGAEIVYEDKDDPESRFYIRIPVDDAEDISADSDTFTVNVKVRFSRPFAYNYASEESSDQNVTLLQLSTSNTLSDSASATLKLEKTGIEIHKTDSETGNGVAGALYGVYSDSACTDLVAVLGPTDEDGYASVEFVKHQDVYYVQETDASELYVVNTEVNEVSVVVSETSTVETAEDSVKGQIALTKTDSDSGSSAQGNATIEGAVYGLYAAEDIEHPDGHTGVLYETDELVASLETSESGSLIFENLYLGSYYIREITPSEGYTLDEAEYEVALSYEDQTTPIVTDSETVTEDVIRGGVSICKTDAEIEASYLSSSSDERSGTSASQGNASLEGAEFEIVNLSNGTVVVNGESFDPGETVMTIVTDEEGYASTESDALPYGHYSIQEVTAPKGYLLDDAVYEFDITEDGEIVAAGEDGVHSDSVIRGGVSIRKTDAETGNTSQGDGSLEGAEFEIINLSDKAVLVDGTLYENGEVVAVITTDKDGYASTESDTLPYGHYSIQEVTAPSGYLLDETVYEFDIEEDGVIVEAGEEGTHPNPIIRGGVAIEKKDLESRLSSPLGAASLEGAEFEIVNLSDEAVLVDGTLYEYGEVVKTITTDEDGYASTESDTLPYGHYSIQEVTAPQGYLLTDGTAYEFDITEDGEIVTAGEDGEAVYDQVKRGDVDFTKTDEDSQERLFGVPFLITSETTGESHVLVTDANGYASTSADWNSHTFSTNANDAAVSIDEDGNYVVDESLLDPEAGIWFGLTEEGWIVDADDSLGALPYDTYTITELPCSANEGLTLVEASLTITRDGYTVEYGTIDDPTPDYTTPSVTTSAANEETGTRYAAADDEVIIIDTVSYDNLEVGETYTVSGVLMDRETGDEFLDADGNTVTGTTTFTATAASGSAEVEYVFDATGMDGAAVVVFESLYSSEGELVAEHKDLTDDYQTVLFPAVDTEAVDYETGVDMSGADDSVTIIDTVSYSNLQENRRYRIVGVLMDASTGEALLDADGNEVTAETAIKPESSDGTVELAFTFDGSALAGTDVVVYEYVYRLFNLYASHEDIEDEDQTVHFPAVETTALDSETGIGVSNADDSVTIIDTVFYANVLAGETYTVEGILMDASAGEAALDADGNEITAEAEFTAEETSGTVEVSFTFDASGLEGSSFVVFENLYWGEYLIASHEDIEDEGQTVDFPAIGTTALDSETGTHEAMADSEVTLVDTVEYTGLTVGKEYTVSGVLYDPETGEPLEVDGEEVTAETAFTAESSDGTVELSFTFDGSALAGQTVVAFETLYYNGYTIAVHADINDEDQAVHFPEIGTMASDSETGIGLSNADDSVTIIDTVFYANVLAGETYTVEGILMDASAGEAALDADGNEVTAEAEFTAEKTSGTVEVSFTFDASGLEGSSFVVFENLYWGEYLIASHEDIEDEGQTVDFPAIGTTALDSETGTHESHADSEVTIIDTVEYTGLTIGKEYTVSGVLYDPETGEPLEVDGEEVTSETAFTAETSDGSVELVFTFDGSALAGQTVVAFETLYYEENIIAVHADIEDEGQTVYFPGIGTSAADADDGDSEVLADEEAEIIDTVSYSNLKTGEIYKVSGILYDKETGEPLEIGGEEVTAEAEFTAEETSGTIEVSFAFDASGLEGKEIVVFETLRNVNGDTVASHEDIEDEGQTVIMTVLPAAGGESDSAVRTEDRSMAAGWAALIGFATAACGIAAAVSRRNRRKETDVR